MRVFTFAVAAGLFVTATGCGIVSGLDGLDLCDACSAAPDGQSGSEGGVDAGADSTVQRDATADTSAAPDTSVGPDTSMAPDTSVAPTGVLCVNVHCNKGEACCISNNSGACGAANSCGTVPLECASAADCTGGKGCCADRNGQGKATQAQCQDPGSCPGGVWLCDPNAPSCPNALTCKSAATIGLPNPPYGYCN